MGENTKIEWADHTFNPWWGCARVSEGCRFCYAESTAKRWGKDVWGEDAERRAMSDAYWATPLKWNRDAEAAHAPARVFCASMADVFEDRPDVAPHRERLWDVVESTPWLVWLLLTKRPENIRGLLPPAWSTSFPPNVWLGATVENQPRADERVPVLLESADAPVFFLSYEPAVGGVVLRPEWLGPRAMLCGPRPSTDEGRNAVAAVIRLTGRAMGGHYVDWVIAGGESGPQARVPNPRWFAAMRDQCQAAGVPFMFKQWGEWRPLRGNECSIDGDRFAPGDYDGPMMRKVGKAAAGRELDGRTWNGVPPILLPA